MSTSACSSSAAQAGATAAQAGSTAAQAGAVSPASARRPSSAPVRCLVLAGLLWGTGGLTGTLLGAAAGLSPLWVAALRLVTGGAVKHGGRAVTAGRQPDEQAEARQRQGGPRDG